jgi:hypothetical protein
MWNIINSVNPCYYSIRILSLRLLSKTLTIRKFKTMIVSVVMYQSSALRKEHQLQVALLKHLGKTKMAVFWVVTSCSLVEIYRRFRGPCCLHHRCPDDAKTNSVTTVQRLGVRQRRRLRTTPTKWSSRIETAHHRRCGNHKQGHAGESLDRNGLSDWCVSCDTGFPHWVFVR